MAVNLIEELKDKGIQFEHKKKKCVGFHGTSKIIAEKVLKDNFNLDYCNSAAWLGRGIYFYDNAPFVEEGSEFAHCHAVYGAKAKEPTVLMSDLDFILLLDLDEEHNARLFWVLHGLMLKEDNDVDDLVVAFLIGTEVAKEMKSEAVGWRFPKRESKAVLDDPKYKPKKQFGFAVKQVKTISGTRLHKRSSKKPR